MIQNLHIGNALRLFLQPPVGALKWRVLRKPADNFTGPTDAGAIVAYEGNEVIFTDVESLKNEEVAFYRPYYTSDGTNWTAGPTNHATPTADYVDNSPDVLGLLRDRLEAGLLVECQRGNFLPELGYIQVFTAPPSLERDLRLPLVTVHLESDEPGERGIGETIGGDEFDAIGFDWDEDQSWLASVQITVIGWSANSDERIELRKAIRRIIVGNLEVFASKCIQQVSISQHDIDAVNGEYPSPMYQCMSNFSCVSPVHVGGPVGVIQNVTQTITE